MIHRVRVPLLLAVFALTVLALPLTPVSASDLPPGGTFVDDDDLLEEGYLEAIAALGVTKGCNPPANDKYCPDRAVIRGETPHFDYLATAVAHGLGRVGLDSGIPTIFGVLTTDTVEQAEARAAAGPANKGREAALAALEMIHLFREIDRRGKA